MTDGTLSALRDLMARKGWDAVLVSGSDPHASEYVAPRWKQVEWLSGFTGEGCAVVTADHAGIWTDSRYFILAGQQLPGTGFELHKTRVPEQVLIPQWLAEKFKDDSPVIAVDGFCTDVTTVSDILKACKDARIANIPDLLDEIRDDRPPVPSSPIMTLGEEQTGWSRSMKIGWLRRWLSERGMDAMLVSALDEIAWMLNVRGSDISYNPVVMSYLLITPDDVSWYVTKDDVRLDDETKDSFYELRADGVKICPYADIEIGLSDIADDENIGKLYIDPSSLNYSLYYILKNSRLGAGMQDDGNGARGIIPGKSPIALRKAVKNELEIRGMREAHLEDGLAMEEFLYWLEKSLGEWDEESRARRNIYDSMMYEDTEAVPLTEARAAAKLHELRSRIPGFRGESFETISAYGPGAALPHYVTPEEDSPELKPRGLYLVDSGGQYLFGTTDITRTVPLGPCEPLECEDYTLVLRGHIQLAMAIFPQGTAGCQIDALAREPLWKSKRSFGHGTGHGVGCYLNVHEGPQDIRQNFNRQPLLPGMITSDEPGIYREGKWGVRHENLLLCKNAGKNDFGQWLEFEPLTLCHFDTSILVTSLMEKDEIEWLNAYNARVYDELSPRLPKEIAEWLKEKTRPV